MITAAMSRAVRRVVACMLLLPVCLDSRGADKASPSPDKPPGAATTKPPAVKRAPADQPLAPADVLKNMALPEGFQATLFAGEPDVVQPIGMTIDDRGRLWVVENFSYPGWKSEGADRVVIFEDKDGDGRFDSRKVFFDCGVNLTSVAVGFGGVWLLSVPRLIYIPDADGDDQPDGPPITLLDGWNIKESGHNAVNGLVWGPDGWLWGLNGIQSKSLVGPPGSAPDRRVRLDCSVWRYHPTRCVFEAVAHGTTNPWGLDFDEFGQAFITNCVIGHLWHVIPGGHYERMYGRDVNPHSYALMPQCADHYHWVGAHWSGTRGNSREQDPYGGGHAHVGAMIYLGDNWPAAYRNSIFTCNLHGNRVNRDLLEQRGSGYVGRHAPDFLTVADPWFRGISILLGPDGGVYVSDWSDTGECHNYKAVDRSNGRIYKIVYGPTFHPRRPEDVSKLSNSELIDRLAGTNAWQSRRAARILQERAQEAESRDWIEQNIAGEIRDKKFLEDDDPKKQLRGVWALHAIGGLDDSLLQRLLSSRNEYTRGWAIRLELEDWVASSARLAALAEMAKSDPSPVVRMFLASGLQRLPLDDRWPIAAELLKHKEDAEDKNLSLMTWYGFEPLVAEDMSRATRLAAGGENAVVRRFAARRAVEQDPDAGLNAVLAAVAEQTDADREFDLLDGVQQAIGGRRHVALPAAWREAHARLAASTDRRLRSAARRLAVLFGDPEAIAAERRTALDRAAPILDRCEAIDSLSHIKDSGLPALLYEALDQQDSRLAGPALRALAGYDDPATPTRVLEHYSRFDDQSKRDAISTLASRASWAEKLLAAIESGAVPRGGLQAYHIQQLAGLKNDKITARIQELWGSARPTSEDKLALMRKYRSQLTSQALAEADLSHGRALFARNCAACHTLYGEGGKIGPDLTGSQRANLDYVLSNILDPSAVVAREYQITLVQTSDGRVIAGIIKRDDGATLTLQTATEQVSLPVEEVEERQTTKTSIMPDGLFTRLSDAEVRDLVAYLASREQAPLKGE